MKQIAVLSMSVAIASCAAASRPDPIAAAAGPTRHAACEAKSLRVLEQDDDGGGWLATFSCQGGVAVLSAARTAASWPVRYTRYQLLDDEWRRLWQAVDATGWRTPAGACQQEVAPSEHRSAIITITDGATERTIVCEGSAHWPSPFGAISDRVTDRMLAIPDDAWQTGPEAKVVLPPMGKIGVASCDEFIEKYRRCIEDHMPQAGKQQALDGLRQVVDAWRQAGTTPEGRAALANACHQMTSTQAQATRAMGCNW
jgi:hypothetical protein